MKASLVTAKSATARMCWSQQWKYFWDAAIISVSTVVASSSSCQQSFPMSPQPSRSTALLALTFPLTYSSNSDICVSSSVVFYRTTTPTSSLVAKSTNLLLSSDATSLLVHCYTYSQIRTLLLQQTFFFHKNMSTTNINLKTRRSLILFPVLEQLHSLT